MTSRVVIGAMIGLVAIVCAGVYGFVAHGSPSASPQSESKIQGRSDQRQAVSDAGNGEGLVAAANDAGRTSALGSPTSNDGVTKGGGARNGRTNVGDADGGVLKGDGSTHGSGRSDDAEVEQATIGGSNSGSTKSAEPLDPLEEATTMLRVLEMSAVGAPLSHYDLRLINEAPKGFAPIAIEAIARILPENGDDRPHWSGADTELVRALILKAADADEEVLTEQVLKMLANPWGPETWSSNGNLARWQSRVESAAGDTPLCYCVGPRGAAYSMILAVAAKRDGLLLPKARLMIREIADDASPFGAGRRESAEPWISQLIESCVAVGAAQAAHQLLWDLDPLNREELAERARARGDSDLMETANQHESIAQREYVNLLWTFYQAGTDKPSLKHPVAISTRPRAWSVRLRKQAELIERLRRLDQDPIVRWSPGSGRASPYPEKPMDGFFEIPTSMDVDAFHLATSRVESGDTWVDAKNSVVGYLRRVLLARDYPVEDLRLACQRGFERLIADEPGSWAVEIRVDVIDLLYSCIRAKTDRDRSISMQGDSGGTTSGMFLVRDENEMTELVMRLCRYPREYTNLVQFDRIRTAFEFVLYSKSSTNVALDGCTELLDLIVTDATNPASLTATPILFDTLASRFDYTDDTRRDPKYAALLGNAVRTLGRILRQHETARVAAEAEDLVAFYTLDDVLERILSVGIGTPAEAKRDLSKDVREVRASLYSLYLKTPPRPGSYRDRSRDREFAEQRINMLFAGWDV